jgi:glyoxylase I family protein
MIQGIEHTAIASPDPKKLADWYVEHLDFVINFEPPNTKIKFIKAANGSMIEIIDSVSAGGPYAFKAPGLRHLAILVSDFDAVYDRLKGKGVKFFLEKTTVGGNTTAFFNDCDGNILHLLHREKPLP